MGWDGTGRVPVPGTSSRSEVHLVEAAGNVEIFVREPELWSLGSPQAIPVPRPWGRDHPVLHPQSVFVDFLCGLGICIFSCVDVAELLHFWE